MESDTQMNTDPVDAESRQSSTSDELAEILAEKDKYKDLAYRAAAEFENYKRRSAREREESAAAMKERFVSRFLQVLDAFELAELAIAEVPADVQKKYLDGYRAIGRQIQTTLEGMGLTVIPVAADAVFNPEEHEAVMTEIVPGLPPAATIVIQMLQKGYRLDGRLIRPARVKVGISETENEKVDQER